MLSSIENQRIFDVNWIILLHNIILWSKQILKVRQVILSWSFPVNFSNFKLFQHQHYYRLKFITCAIYCKVEIHKYTYKEYLYHMCIDPFNLCVKENNAKKKKKFFITKQQTHTHYFIIMWRERKQLKESEVKMTSILCSDTICTKANKNQITIYSPLIPHNILISSYMHKHIW